MSVEMCEIGWNRGEDGGKRGWREGGEGGEKRGRALGVST